MVVLQARESNSNQGEDHSTSWASLRRLDIRCHKAVISWKGGSPPREVGYGVRWCLSDTYCSRLQADHPCGYKGPCPLLHEGYVRVYYGLVYKEGRCETGEIFLPSLYMFSLTRYTLAWQRPHIRRRRQSQKVMIYAIILHYLELIRDIRQRRALSSAFTNAAIRAVTPVFYDSAYKVLYSISFAYVCSEQPIGQSSMGRDSRRVIFRARSCH